MNYIQTEKDSVLMGCGYLYAIPAKDFTPDIDISTMDEIGYIKEEAIYRRTHDSQEITSANYGLIELIAGNYVTEFETGVISYNAGNVSKYLTGSSVVVDGNKKTTYFCEHDKIPTVSLVFVGHDEDTGNEFKLLMPKCKWMGEYELNFNVENPVELNYYFRCLNTTLPNGKVGAAWIEETITDTVAE